MTTVVVPVAARDAALLEEIERLHQRVARLERRVARLPHRALSVKCPDCGAEPKEACVSMSGRRAGSPHRARREAVYGR